MRTFNEVREIYENGHIVQLTKEEIEHYFILKDYVYFTYVGQSNLYQDTIILETTSDLLYVYKNKIMNRPRIKEDGDDLVFNIQMIPFTPLTFDVSRIPDEYFNSLDGKRSSWGLIGSRRNYNFMSEPLSPDLRVRRWHELLGNKTDEEFNDLQKSYTPKLEYIKDFIYQKNLNDTYDYKVESEYHFYMNENVVEFIFNFTKPKIFLQKSFLFNFELNEARFYVREHWANNKLTPDNDKHQGTAVECWNNFCLLWLRQRDNFLDDEQRDINKLLEVMQLEKNKSINKQIFEEFVNKLKRKIDDK